MRPIHAVLSLGLGLTAVEAPKADSERAIEPPGQLVDIGARRLHLLCKGSGRPTVVLESGLAEAWVTWVKVHDELAKTTRVCAYDRAGVGFSDPGPTPRTSLTIARELHSLLRKANVPAPYVLVGHSIGGYHVRAYAHLFLEDVAGLVLIDASHEDQATLYPAQLRDREMQIRASLREKAERAERGELKDPLLSLGGFGPEVEVPLAAVAARPAWYRALSDEMEAASASAAEVRESRTVLSIPLIVVSAGRNPREPPDVKEKIIEAHREMQADLLKLSSKACQIRVEDSGHNVHWQRPQIVVGAVVEMVAALRRPQGEPGQGARVEPR